MSTHHLFEVLIALHIAAGAPGLLTFWAPIAARKGGRAHRLSGRFFASAMLFTGAVAATMSTFTLAAPMATHPHLVDHPQFSDPTLVRGIFGWMMLYLAILTINLSWYGWRCAVNKRDHARNAGWGALALQAVLAEASVNCAVRGALIGQPMMIGVSFVGFATVATNLMFIYKKNPSPIDWLLEHIKGFVGTGISVYTAFLAFGAVRLVPELALAPILWAAPLVTGVWLIIHHQRAVARRAGRRGADVGLGASARDLIDASAREFARFAR
ncbi:MAG: hypothetical protein ACFB00_01805 [Parvularculaceae bacterium]